ncbi:lipoyl protein ligase domain-containing protein [Halorubrum alkaliphilum]|nr:lipoate--protein ligase family protein [Halorubrum alkaliphilum]
MRVLRGGRERPSADREATANLLESAADGTAGVRVWVPPRQIAFGRRDTRASGYPDATAIAENAGFTPIERDVGGRAVPYTGDTLAFATAVPRTNDDERTGLDDGSVGINGGSVGIDDRYAWATGIVRTVLVDLGGDIEPGEPPASFCPGDHSIRVAAGGKLSGIAQRVRADAALVAGCLVVTRSDASELASIASPVYDALGVPFDPDSVGSVEAAGGSADHRTVARAVETAFVRALDRDGPDDEPSRDGRREIVRVGPEPW